MTIRLCAALIVAAVPMYALACEDHAHLPEVSGAYIRSSNPMNAAGFMQIDNHGEAACTLTGASSPAGKIVELHTHIAEGDVMRMVKIEGGIEIPAEGSHALARGGDHVMLMGLTAPLKQGDSVALTLDFGDCGKLDLTVPVDNERTPEPGAMSPGMGQGAGHGHAHGAAPAKP